MRLIAVLSFFIGYQIRNSAFSFCLFSFFPFYLIDERYEFTLIFLNKVLNAVIKLQAAVRHQLESREEILVNLTGLELARSRVEYLLSLYFVVF